MTVATSPGTEPPHDDAATGTHGYNLEPRIAKAFARFAGGFWTGSTQSRAWGLTLGLTASLVLSTYATVYLNNWNRLFFDALENRDVAGVKSAIVVFIGIIVCMAAIGVAIVITRETLQVRWRQWLVEKLVERWLDRQRFYRLGVTGLEPANPEYRISDDTRWATEMLVDLGIGLVSAVLGGVAFISILWTVGGSFTWGAMTIPGYMVWVALAYGILASLVMAWIGQPLVGAVGTKNESEGYFRFAMMRLRDNAEQIALMRGGPGERFALSRAYDMVVSRWLRIVRSHGHLTWITNASGPMIPIIPLLFAAPKYLAGDLTLGQVTQLAAAFIQVQIAISWVVDNYNRIAEWYASARRVMDIVDACATVEDQVAPTHAHAGIGTTGIGPAGIGPTGVLLALSNITATGTNGEHLFGPLTLSLTPGQWVHITGPSSIGKSTLTRILAGLAPPASGDISVLSDASVVILPQKAYLPLGSLRDILKYPSTGSNGEPDLTATTLSTALDRVGLGHLAPRLDDSVRWDQSLSNGERQRIGVARILLHRPDLAIIDDAVSALDDASRDTLIRALRQDCPSTAFISLGQKPLATDIAARHILLTDTTLQSAAQLASSLAASSMAALSPARA
jgi:vitamin B12/bleomycin/antimicrobial peptide transport system ATP-binding/permease protein